MSAQHAFEAMALAAVADQAIEAQRRLISGGKRQRCVCGALEGESCRDHSQVMAFYYINGELRSVQQGDRTLWRASDEEADRG